ncbi:hypothetical protein Sjap_019653 [Stephania japonica]|uniref:Uncharacterized protein n=1 Tax=Stephania japonica TaxID=461633 RepID=A0AAP0F835_9MAGN
MASSSLQNTLSLHSSSHQLGFQKLGHAPHSTRRAVSTFLAKAGHADTAASCRRARQDVEAMLFASDCSIVKKFLKPEKFSIVFNSTKRSKRLKLPFEIDRTLSASQTISSASNATRTIDLEGSCDTRQSLLCYNHATVIHMLTHEV